MNPKARNLIQVNTAVLIWGGTAMFAKGINLPVQHIICIRSLIAAFSLLVFLLVSKASLRLARPGHALVMLVLGLLLCGHWLTYFQALKVSTAAIAILSLSTYPVFTALIEPLVFRETLRKPDIALACGVLLGIVVMTPEISISNSSTYGIALGTVSGLFFMVRNLMTRRYVKEYTSSMLMFWQTLVTGLVLLPILFMLRPDSPSETSPWTFLVLGVVFTALPQTLFAAGFKNLTAKTVAVLAALLPFYGAFFGYLIHRETVDMRTALGGMIVLICIIVETIRSARA